MRLWGALGACLKFAFQVLFHQPFNRRSAIERAWTAGIKVPPAPAVQKLVRNSERCPHWLEKILTLKTLMEHGVAVHAIITQNIARPKQ